MYGLSKDLAVNESNYFDAGIHSDVTLEKVTYENVKKDGTGKMVLAFHFKGNKGETFRHVEWPIESSDANADTKLTNMGKRIKHILTKFVPEENVVIANVETFEQYANAIISILGASNVGKKIAIKLLYDDKGNLGFPKYVGFIANDASSLKISNTEKITKPTPSAPGSDDFVATTNLF